MPITKAEFSTIENPGVTWEELQHLARVLGTYKSYQTSADKERFCLLIEPGGVTLLMWCGHKDLKLSRKLGYSAMLEYLDRKIAIEQGFAQRRAEYLVRQKMTIPAQEE